MVQEFSEVTGVSEVAYHTILLEFSSPEIARLASPGQFVNLRKDDPSFPLLRRAMSICDVDGTTVKILFSVVGRGTALLSKTKTGETLDVIGPLGHGFNLSRDFELAVIVGGGLGVAPFPFVTRELLKTKKKIATFIGVRTANQLALGGLENVAVATDDGSEGFRGSVVDLFRTRAPELGNSNPVIFSCGPTPMFEALQRVVREANIPCEASVETPMACGIGLCQGCPVEMMGGIRKYKLSCKDGPIFDLSHVVF